MTATPTLPAVLPPSPSPLPDAAEATLGSGLRVLAVRRAGVPMVEIRLRVPFAGAEPAHLARATVLADTLLAGTAERSQVELAAALQRLGAGLSASVDADRLALGGSALAPELGSLLALLAEILTGASYPEPQVSVERDRLVERLAVARSQPGRIAREALLRLRYGDHPYGRELPGEDEVAAVSAAALRRLHAGRVAPRGALLVLVGDLRPGDAIEQARAALGGWTATGPEVAVPPVPPVPSGPALLVDRPGSVQTTIRLAGAAPRRTDPGYAAAKLANLVYGGYFSSRLVANIRERRGYTYSPRSAIEHAPAGSLLTVAADVATAVTAPALLEIAYELGRIAAVPVEAAELDAARRYAIGSLTLSTATQAGLASTLAALAEAGLGLEELHDHPRDLEAVTLDDVLVAARQVLAPTRLVGVLVGDAAATRDAVAAVTPLAAA